ncbi:MAG: amidohydrolase family protein [Gemmatimonadota bacterium]
MRRAVSQIPLLLAVSLASLGAMACPNPVAQNEPRRDQPVPAFGAGPLAIVDVTVIVRPDQPALSHRTVLVKDGVITAVGPAVTTAVPSDALVIEGAGRFLMAGLADMHVHVFDRDEFLLYLANGITTIRNLSGYGMHLAWRDSLAAGTIAGPHLVTSGPILDGDPPMRSTNTVIRDAAAAEIEVRRQVDAGYDLVKLYDNISPEAYVAVTAAAHRLGKRVVGHLPTPVGLALALSPGSQDEIEHLEELLPLFDDGRNTRELDSIARAIASAGVAVTPTMTVYASALDQATAWASVQVRPEMRYVNPATRRQWGWDETGAARSGQPGQIARYQRTTAFFRDQLLPALRRAGVTLLIGSDAPIATLVPGFSLHTELMLFRAAGVPDQEVLTMATVNAAAALGASSHRGEVRVGYDADMLLLNSDPRLGLAALSDRVGVIAAGRWYAQRELTRRLDSLAASSH